MDILLQDSEISGAVFPLGFNISQPEENASSGKHLGGQTPGITCTERERERADVETSSFRELVLSFIRYVLR